jgi:asparagine synthase (glutamine-hydrolysing)
MAGAVSRLVHRGPDAQHVWTAGPVGLAHALLATTPQDALGRQPHVEDGFAIVADARLDDRGALGDRLSDTGPPCTDAACLLRLYRRGGVDALAGLVGAFAFVLWDPHEQRLVAGRDVAGIRPLYYSDTPAGVTLASEVAPILGFGDVPDAIDETSIADYLAGICLDADTTFYEAVRVLPPGHVLTAGASGVRVRRFDAYEADDMLSLPSNAAYAEAFREVLGAAVRDRLHASGPVASFLSGGLDSSAIAALAHEASSSPNGSLFTISTVFDRFPQVDERSFIRDVLRTCPLPSRLLRGDDARPVSSLPELVAAQGAPFTAPNASVSWAQYASVREGGSRVVLDGHGGDEVVSHGMGRLTDLARARRLGALLRECRGLSAIDGQHGALGLWARYVHRFVVDPALARWPRAQSAARRIHGVIGEPRGAASSFVPHRDLVHPDLARRVHLPDRVREWTARRPPPGAPERDRHRFVIESPLMARSLTILDHFAAARGVEARYPFWDRRVVEFCLSLPVEQKLDGGWGRVVVRRALRDDLPASVCWRRGKADFTPVLHRGVTSEKEHLHALVLAQGKVGKDYMQESSVSDLWTYATGSDAVSPGPALAALLNVATLVQWVTQKEAQARNESGSDAAARAVSDGAGR